MILNDFIWFQVILNDFKTQIYEEDMTKTSFRGLDILDIKK
jgi:hypothetical protein